MLEKFILVYTSLLSVISKTACSSFNCSAARFCSLQTTQTDCSNTNDNVENVEL